MNAENLSTDLGSGILFVEVKTRQNNHKIKDQD